MTKAEIEERRLRRLEKRIRHLDALLRVMKIFGGKAQTRTEDRVRRLFLQENARLWDMLYPNGEPEDQARIVISETGTGPGSRAKF